MIEQQSPTVESKEAEIDAPKTAGPIAAVHTHEVREFKHKIPLTTLRVDPTDRFVAAGAEDLDVQLWNIESGEHQTLTGHRSWVRSIDFTPNGSQMLTACWGGEVRIWDCVQKKVKLLQHLQAHRGSARWVRVSPDGKTFATCGNDLLVKHWNLADGKLIRQFEGHQRHVYGVEFHPSGKHLVSQDLMGIVKIWNLETGHETKTIDASVMTGYDRKFAADMGGSRDLHFHPDGQQWASAGITNVVNSFAGKQDPIVVLFDWELGTVKHQMKGEKNVQGIAWGVRHHPQGFLVVAVADSRGKGELWFFHAADDKPFHTVKLAKAARGLDLVGDDRLAIAHVDGTVKIYSMRKAKPETPEKADSVQTENK